MSHQINSIKIIPNEQKGNANNTFDTTDQLIINKMMMDNIKLKRWNISTTWIDYKKAFDSVPHDWIIETLKGYNFDLITTKFLRKQWISDKRCCTSNTEMVKLTAITFSINTGIFKEIDCHKYYSTYRYFHSLGYWTQATLDIELITKMRLCYISYSWTILKSLLEATISLHQW